MSRVGRMPIDIPSGVEVSVNGSEVKVKGPKGEMSHRFPKAVSFSQEDAQLVVARTAEDKFSRSMHGTARAVVNNMVVGVSTGFVKTLEVHGVGYRPELNGKTLVLHVGYSHPVEFPPPDGIGFEVDTKANVISVTGYDKEMVGETAAKIRMVRPPEPYKGKGIRYQGEHVRRKAGKAGKAA